MVRCALISTSGNLLLHQFGQSINEYDIVIRTGQAPIRGFEQYVGNRTDYRIISTSTFEKYRRINIKKFRNDIASETIVYTKFRKFLDKSVCDKVHVQLNMPKQPYMCFINSARNCRHTAKWKRDPSTGFDALFFAFQKLSCSSTKLYGFNTSEALVKPYHYWTDGSAHDNKNGKTWYAMHKSMHVGHDFEAEHAFFYKLSDNWTITKHSFERACKFHSKSSV